MQEIHVLFYFSCVEIFLGSLAFHNFRPCALVDSKSLSLSLYALHTRFCLFFNFLSLPVTYLSGGIMRPAHSSHLTLTCYA